MNKRISLVTCGLLLGANMAFAADTIDEAFKNGAVSGSVTAYGIYTDKKENKLDTKEGYGTVNLAYETASFMGLSAKAGFEAGHAVEDGSLDNDALMTEAYIKYARDGFDLTVGRQAIDLEWLGDYNEAIVAGITAIPDTTLVLGYVNQQAAADEDEIGDFEQLTEDGVYVIDAKYTGFDGVELNPYVYSAPDAADFYGLKATYSSDMFGALAHYAASDEDVSATDDGSVLALELSTSLSDVSLAAGYIKTDKDGGLGSIATYGDNYEPMDDGSAIYEADAKMVYGSIGYSIAGVDLGALYSQTKVGSLKDKELNLTAGYSFTDSLSASLLYVNIDAEAGIVVDQQYTSATLAYTF